MNAWALEVDLIGVTEVFAQCTIAFRVFMWRALLEVKWFPSQFRRDQATAWNRWLPMAWSGYIRNEPKCP